MERRYHNPYRHWLAGLSTEIVTFSCVLALLAAACLAAGLVAR